MQLNVTTDYAIRMVLYLALRGEVVTSHEISTAMQIPQPYVVKMAKNLRDSNIIGTERGVNGGYILLRPPEDISLYDIISGMEDTMYINRCLEEDEYCSRNATASCPVRQFYVNLQNLLEDQLRNMTIKKLM